MLKWTQLLRQWDQGLKRNHFRVHEGLVPWTCVEKKEISSKEFYDTKRVGCLAGKVPLKLGDLLQFFALDSEYGRIL